MCTSTHLVGEQEGLHEWLVGRIRRGKGAYHQHKHTVVRRLLSVHVAIGEVHLCVLQVQSTHGSADGLRTGCRHTRRLQVQQANQDREDVKEGNSYTYMSKVGMKKVRVLVVELVQVLRALGHHLIVLLDEAASKMNT
jgi:hypothetical protein